jgi:hypothetical protein
MIAMASDPRWQRETAIAVLILLTLAAAFLRATSAGGKREGARRGRFALLAFFGSPLIGASIAGLIHALGHVHPMDVEHLYSAHIGIGVVAGSILGLFFALTSLLSSDGPESSPRNPNP